MVKKGHRFRGGNMKEYIEEFKKMPLFKGIKEEEMEPMLTCIGGKVKQDKKGVIIAPVSYTHLDVYKRQTLDSACALTS